MTFGLYTIRDFEKSLYGDFKYLLQLDYECVKFGKSTLPTLEKYV